MANIMGLDLSAYNGVVNFEKLKKSGVEFVIIRLGYGGNYLTQDDKKVFEYVEGAKKSGIPYGLYLYSYATDLTKCQSEIAHALRIANRTGAPLGVWYDIEDTTYYKKFNIDPYRDKALLCQFAEMFCDAMVKNGYKTGVYANEDYWRRVLDRLQGIEKWCANWSRKPSIDNVKIWQYKGSCSGERVDGSPYANDFNYWLFDFPNSNEPIKPVEPKEEPKKEEPKEEPKKDVTYKTGDVVILEKCGLYSASTSSKAVNHVSGNYYIWNDRVLKDRIRITTKKEYCNNAKCVTGWVNISDIKGVK